ncbi:hypothetical protein [Thiohalocapsa marina]|uniref:hypothetical protein n=1 Tax=Thiohalocapsa marina TaxID=424902 RepID=UPI001B87071B|nr:hypothetical protein [Thiohalocapsa marina]
MIESAPGSAASDHTDTPQDPLLLDIEQIEALADAGVIRAALRHSTDHRVTALDRSEDGLWAEVEDEETEADLSPLLADHFDAAGRFRLRIPDEIHGPTGADHPGANRDPRRAISQGARLLRGELRAGHTRPVARVPETLLTALADDTAAFLQQTAARLN